MKPYIVLTTVLLPLILANTVCLRAYADITERIVNTPEDTAYSDGINDNFSDIVYSLSGSDVLGGALENLGKIGNITGNFTDNHVFGTGTYAEGGGIYNKGTIGDITGNFIGNYASSAETSSSEGGAIDNYDYGTIGNITGDFTGNYVYSSGASAFGGAVYNGICAEIGDIDGDFTNNYAYSSGSSSAHGGAVYNAYKAVIGKITGNFTNSYAYSTGSSSAQGGAIDNGGTIEGIEGNFKDNCAYSTAYDAYSGAIYNYGTIGDITGDFTGNHAKSDSGTALGGAIYNSLGSIGNINGNFSENYVYSANSYAAGGAIDNFYGTIGSITGDFTACYAESGSGMALGGAVYNEGTINEIVNSSFYNNYAKSDSGTALGGAIYTQTNITIAADNGTSAFSGNYTQSNDTTEQNAIYAASDSAAITLKAENSGTITFDDTIDGTSGYSLNMTGDATGKIELNNLVQNAKASLETAVLKIGVTDSENNTSDVFASSTLTANSGTVDVSDGSYTNYNIQQLTSSEDVKYNIDLIAESADNLNADTFTIGSGSSGTVHLSSINVNSEWADDDTEYTLQILYTNNSDKITLDWDNENFSNSAKANMTSSDIVGQDFGLVSSYGSEEYYDSIMFRGLKNALVEWAKYETDEDKSYTLLDGVTMSLSKDAAVVGNNITISGSGTLDLQNHTFLDTISEDQNVTIADITVKNSNDITNEGVLTLDSVTLSDEAAVTNESELNITGKTSLSGVLTNNEQTNITEAEITFDNEITGSGNIDVKDSTVNLNNSVSNQLFTVTNSDITLSDVSDFNHNNSLLMNSGNFNIDSLGMTALRFDYLSLNGGNINLNNVDVDLANKIMGTITADEYGSAEGAINVNGLTVITDTNEAAVSVKFVDSAMKNAVNSSITEAVGPIYKYAVSYSNDGTYGEDGYFAFARVSSGNEYEDFNPSIFAAPVAAQLGGFLAHAEAMQQSFFHMNRYTKYPSALRLAAEKNNLYASSEGGIYTRNPLPETSKALWVNPYSTFERVHLKGGIDVSNVAYGTLIGGDTDLYELRKGYKGVVSAFAGYNGSHQAYDGVSIYQNGGMLGVTGTLYKNKFFTGLTAAVGANAGSADSVFGTDNFSMLTAGAASKTGYNFEFEEGRYIIQPSIYLGYTFVNTFDYTNAAGVRINSDPLNALQVIPGVTFIGNLKNGWQPYASVQMVWNTMDKTHFTANEAALPQLSVKPYVQYGAGVQKTWADRFTGFIQAVIRNGGRDGISLQAGFRWALGK